MSWLNFLYKIKSSPTPNVDSSIMAQIRTYYWKLPFKKKYCYGKDYQRWLDIGVIIDGVSANIEEVAICFPFNIKKENIVDLSNYVKEDRLASHILRKRYVTSSLPDTPAYYRFENRDDKKDDYPLYLYEICEKSIHIEHLQEGSKLVLKILSHPKDPNEIKESPDEASTEPRKYSIYFQFRVNNLSETDLCHNENISNDLVQSAFSKSEIVDVIFNDLTHVDHSDHQSLTSEYSILKISHVDFVFIGSSEDETVIGNKPFDDCELLDNKLWGEYLKDINPDKKKCIAYHWILPNKPWKVFFKTVYSSRQGWKIAKYSLYVILLSFLASLILEGCKWDVQEIRKLMAEPPPQSQPIPTRPTHQEM